jgi:hypothetical protein
MNEQTGNYIWAKDASKLDYSWAKLSSCPMWNEAKPIGELK